MHEPGPDLAGYSKMGRWGGRETGICVETTKDVRIWSMD
jgi:hypothetical protein